MDRQLGGGQSSTLEDGTLTWKKPNLAIELTPAATGVELTIREDCSGLLRQAVWSGLGTGLILSLIIFLLPLAIPIGIFLASTGLSNSLNDATNIASILKIILGLLATAGAVKRRQTSIREGLKHRRAELETLANRCVKNLSPAL